MQFIGFSPKVWGLYLFNCWKKVNESLTYTFMVLSFTLRFRCTVVDVFEPMERNRIQGFGNDALDRYRDDEFKMLFRMSRESALRFMQHVESIVTANHIPNLSPREIPGGRPEVIKIMNKIQVKIKKNTFFGC